MASLFLLSLSLHSSNWNRQLQVSWHTSYRVMTREKLHERRQTENMERLRYCLLDVSLFRDGSEFPGSSLFTCHTVTDKNVKNLYASYTVVPKPTCYQSLKVMLYVYRLWQSSKKCFPQFLALFRAQPISSNSKEQPPKTTVPISITFPPPGFGTTALIFSGETLEL